MHRELSLLGVAALVLVALSIFAERRRGMRRNLDAVGWVPWSTLTVLGMIAAPFAFALAFKFGT